MLEAVNYNNYLISLIKTNINKNMIILDFGAGIGTFANEIKKEDYNILCIELDDYQRKIIESKDIKTFKTLDEIEDNSLDFIYSLNVLEHIENDLEILEILKNKLKSNGEIFLYLPAFQILFTSMDEKVGHFRRYNFKMLEELAKRCELKIINKSYVDSLGFFATLLYKYVGNKNGDINKKSLIFYDKVIFPISKVFDKLFSNCFGKNVYIKLKKQNMK